MKNIDESDWVLHYSVALDYIDLYEQTHNEEYLQKAYEQLKSNLHYLVKEQKKQNEEYKGDVEQVSADKDASKEEKGVVDAYNKYIKKQREKELPPVYEPLLANCELLFALAEKYDLTQEQKDAVDNILHDEPVFLSYEMDQRYSFADRKEPKGLEDSDIRYSGSKTDQLFYLPAVFAPEGTQVKADVYSGGKHYELDDWEVYEVDRKKSNNVDDFEAIFTTTSDEKIKYQEGDTVLMTIIPPGYIPEEALPVVKLIVDNINILGIQFKLVTE